MNLEYRNNETTKKTNNMKKYKKLIIATIIALVFIGTFCVPVAEVTTQRDRV